MTRARRAAHLAAAAALAVAAGLPSVAPDPRSATPPAIPACSQALLDPTFIAEGGICHGAP